MSQTSVQPLLKQITVKGVAEIEGWLFPVPRHLCYSERG